jgi:hypothetical protein
MLSDGRAVGQDAIPREAVGEEVLLGTQRPGIVVRRFPDLRRNGERDLDEAAEVGVAIRGADLAEVVRRRGGERLEALDDVSAARAHVVPLHVQQADLPCVKEDLDDRGLVAALLPGEADRVHANQVPIVGRPDEGLEHVEDVAPLGKALRELVDLRGEELVVEDHRLIFAYGACGSSPLPGSTSLAAP